MGAKEGLQIVIKCKDCSFYEVFEEVHVIVCTCGVWPWNK